MRIANVLRRIAPGILSALIAVYCAIGAADETSKDRPLVLVAAIEGPIGPATAHHVDNLVQMAEARDADLLVFRINTPGGLATSMRDVINTILGARVPIAGYVAPPGAHAASAGTYILYAMPIVAMAPGTNLGAATPVQIGGLPGLPDGDRKRPAREGEDEPEGGEEAADRPAPVLSGSDAMTAKVTNDAVAFIRSLAEVHGRNADWAERAVREAASLSAGQALEEQVIDIIAADVETLLTAIDGRTVKTGKAKVTLSIGGAKVETVEVSTVTRLLGIISNPNVAFVLMLVGVYGIIFEFMNPGSLLPGVFGAISLVLGLFALNQLPLDYAGLALLILGIAFMVGEAVTPTYGILGIGGLVAFVIGSVMLIDTDIAAYRISWWLVGGMAAVSAAVLVLLLRVVWRSYRRAPAASPNLVAGAEGRVLDWSGEAGHVWVQGERWRATGAADLRPGDTVRVTGVQGVTLVVAARAGDSTQTRNAERMT